MKYMFLSINLLFSPWYTNALTVFNLLPQEITLHIRSLNSQKEDPSILATMQPQTDLTWVMPPGSSSAQCTIALNQTKKIGVVHKKGSLTLVEKSSPIPPFAPWQKTFSSTIKSAPYEKGNFGTGDILFITAQSNSEPTFHYFGRQMTPTIFALYLKRIKALSTKKS